mgnify:CR=1 FL=1|jgi:hypothetical protein
MLRALAFAVTLAVGVASSLGVRAQECERVQTVVSNTATQIPSLSVRAFSGSEAQTIVALWNAAEPVSDDKADVVVLMFSPAIPAYVGVILAEANGCVVAKGSLPMDQIQGLRLSAVRGA